MSCTKSCFCRWVAHHFAVTDGLRVIMLRRTRKAYPCLQSIWSPMNIEEAELFFPWHVTHRNVVYGLGWSFTAIQSLEIAVLCILSSLSRYTSAP